MMRKLVIGSFAEQDIADAYSWYEEQLEGLGRSFLLSLDATYERIHRNPEAFLQVHKQARRALLKRFPYGVFYTVSKEQVYVVSVFHGKRNPTIWKARL